MNNYPETPMHSLKKLATILMLFLLFFFIADFLVAYFLGCGLKKYYGIENSAQILVNGASQVMLAVDKDLIERETGMRVAKYTREGVNISDRELMIHHFFSEKKSSAKIVVYGVDQFLFTDEGMSENSYTIFYPFMDNKEISDYIHTYTKEWYVYKIHQYIRCSRFDLYLVNSAIRGFLGDWSNKKKGEVNISSLKSNIANGSVRKINSKATNIATFQKTMQFLESKNITVVLLYIPYVDILENNDSKMQETKNIFKKYSSDHPAVRFIDLTYPASSEHSWYFDPNHLNPKGQKELTEIVISELKKISK
jgi:hypothetical protein